MIHETGPCKPSCTLPAFISYTTTCQRGSPALAHCSHKFYMVLRHALYTRNTCTIFPQYHSIDPLHRHMHKLLVTCAPFNHACFMHKATIHPILKE
jgi:hypothetical protein